MCSCFVLKKTFFNYNFFLDLNVLIISWFYEAPPSENVMGSDWLAGPLCCDWLNHLYGASECPAPQLSGMCSGCIVNNGVVYIAYQFEPEWDAEDISEEDQAQPVQAQLLMVWFLWFVVGSYF